MYKSKLQELCHRQSWSLPVYTATRTGPDHCPSFKADVTVNNIPFSPTDFGRSSKEAENDVARMAFDHFSASLPSPALSRPSVSPDSDMQHFYKNLLQELTRKEGYSFPVYTTKQSGVHHAPTFVSIVEIETDRFTGQESKTKKQAEMSAAKLACMTLKKRKPSQSPIFPSSSNLQANATADLHQNVRSTGDTVSNLGLVPLEQTKDDRDKRKKCDGRLPAARIKKFRIFDEDFAEISKIFITKALEKFMQDLCKKSYEIALKRGAKAMNSLHLKQCIQTFNGFSFLREIVSKVPDLDDSDTAGEGCSLAKRDDNNSNGTGSGLGSPTVEKEMATQPEKFGVDLDSGEVSEEAKNTQVPTRYFDLNVDLDENGDPITTPPAAG